MDILEDLWLGNIGPGSGTLDPKGPYYKAMCLAADAEKQLRASADPAQKELLKVLENAQTEMLRVTETEAFSHGFRLGIQLLLAGLEKEKT